jgi:hypothetical protein
MGFVKRAILFTSFAFDPFRVQVCFGPFPL